MKTTMYEFKKKINVKSIQSFVYCIYLLLNLAKLIAEHADFNIALPAICKA